MTNNYVTFYLVKAIAEVVKTKITFTAFDIWRHVRENRDGAFPEFSAFETAGAAYCLSAAFKIARRRGLCQLTASCTVAPHGSPHSAKVYPNTARAQRVWEAA